MGNRVFDRDLYYRCPRWGPESWATGVEWRITNDVYSPGQANPPYLWFYQQQSLSWIRDFDGYTPIVIDMIDDWNQQNTIADWPDDRVNGYTLAQLELALYGSPNWWQWRQNIRDLFNNPNEGEPLDYLFQNYTH